MTGGSYGYRIPYEYATIKYDTDGNEQWVARYNGPGPDFDMANAIAVDAEGNVYVTGLSNYASASIKYDNLGNELWVRRDAGYGRALTLDHDGNVYVRPGLSSSMTILEIKSGYTLRGSEMP